MSSQSLNLRMGEDAPNAHSKSEPSGSEPSYGWEAAKATADSVLFQTTQQHLSDVECKVLEGAWQGQTYDQMIVNCKRFSGIRVASVVSH